MISDQGAYQEENQSVDSVKTMKNFSSKIQTISALQRHLSTDLHNEPVLVKTYFKEIIDNYKVTKGENLQVNAEYDEVAIRSNRILYLGLILNELIATTLENSSHPKTLISLAVNKEAHRITLSYEDNQAQSIKKGSRSPLIDELVAHLKGRELSNNQTKRQFRFSL